jgi:hypothetical protein
MWIVYCYFLNRFVLHIKTSYDVNRIAYTLDIIKLCNNDLSE